MASLGLAQAILAIEVSITNGWQGLFPPKKENGVAGPLKRKSAEEQKAEAETKYGYKIVPDEEWSAGRPLPTPSTGSKPGGPT